jgi:hypothetical protein
MQHFTILRILAYMSLSKHSVQISRLGKVAGPFGGGGAGLNVFHKDGRKVLVTTE